MGTDAAAGAPARVSELPTGAGSTDLNGALEVAKAELVALRRAATELRADLPAEVRAGIAEALRDEVVPVARNLAEIRGLSNQQIARLERVQESIDEEREARVEDLDVLVDLLASSWEGLDARLARLEQAIEHLQATPPTT